MYILCISACLLRNMLGLIKYGPIPFPLSSEQVYPLDCPRLPAVVSATGGNMVRPYLINLNMFRGNYRPGNKKRKVDIFSYTLVSNSPTRMGRGINKS